METIFLDAEELKTPQDVHAKLKLLLNLPDYYGGNADALHDCLSERIEPVRVYLHGKPSEEAAAALAKVRMVVSDLEGCWKEI